MPNCDFYAADDDYRLVLDLVFAQPGWTLVELGSIPDQPLRRFRSTDAVLEAFDIERSNALLQLYAPEMGGSVVERQVLFDRGAVGDATGRTDSAGWGLIQVYLYGSRDGRIGLSHTNHNSEARARAWEGTYGDLGPVDAWDWRTVSGMSRRLNRHIRRMAVGRSGSRLILPGAAARVAGGALLSPN